MNTQTPGNISNTQRIARNSFWFGLELIVGIVAALVVSILVARVIGPTRLEPYLYVMFLTNVTAAIGGTGPSNTTRKYMAEYLNRGEAGIARAVYRYALRQQVLIAAGATVAGVIAAGAWAPPGYRWVSVLLVMTLAPRMIGYIPSNANNAAERMKRNTGPSLVGGAVNLVSTLFSLWIGWDLIGIAASFALGATVDAAIKLYYVRAWLAPVMMGTIPPELRKRMFAYSGQGAVLMVLNIVVWDRSDLVILQKMNPDVRQVTFFATAFGLTEKILNLLNGFSASLGATMMAQLGRGAERVRQITVTGAKYTFLAAVPLLAGMACVSRPFIMLPWSYGPKYQPMIPVLTIVAALAIPKAMAQAPTLLLQTVEKQGFLIWMGCLCGAVDIGLDFLLTPSQGAVGAALANGLAQALAAVLVWVKVYRDFRLDLRLGEFARIALSGAAMVGVVLAVQYFVPMGGFLRVALSMAAGALVWFAALRLTGAINKADAERFRHVGQHLPEGMRAMVDRCVSLLATEAI